MAVRLCGPVGISGLVVPDLRERSGDLLEAFPLGVDAEEDLDESGQQHEHAAEGGSANPALTIMALAARTDG